jgi:diguanylate cyclase (GGDEF)-like protein
MNSAPTPVRQDEHVAMAVQLLRLMAVFGIVVAVSDYFTGNLVFPSSSAGIAVLAPLVLLLSRHPRLTRLPLLFSHWLLFATFLVGSLNHFPYRPERAVWITLFPMAYFYLGGPRVGLRLATLSLAILVFAYFVMPGLQGKAVQLTPYAFAQCIGAYIFSAILAYLYERIRTRQTLALQALADRDVLTGLLNRRGFVAQAETAREQAQRFDQAFALVLLDVDDFKQINDRRGHAAGDQLLQQVANLLTLSMRRSDLLARWGGEEFILLLPHTDLEQARTAAEKLRGVIGTQTGAHGPITVSVGVALQAPGETLESAINRADKAMYRAKEGGKNRVVCA